MEVIEDDGTEHIISWGEKEDWDETQWYELSFSVDTKEGVVISWKNSDFIRKRLQDLNLKIENSDVYLGSSYLGKYQANSIFKNLGISWHTLEYLHGGFKACE